MKKKATLYFIFELISTEQDECDESKRKNTKAKKEPDDQVA
jgi:hypothetical protein